ncbi:RiPP maturation radical SAM C-methyltransferase [Neorhizobium galegae]|uniref:RiPP maturation radical SAM C-methyltransferase n=1 Tax=Neorhizobium galegae TaxID=399 RepID=UPI001EF2E446|nr:RiPP maturation radical SAM C-methyltransferase [Neorhizobium galegae]UIK06598.1 RiPP maturation radical SAM C-methyltransferase [Neorhizobium galegae]
MQSILRRDGIECDQLFANVIFSKFLEDDINIERQLTRLPVSEIAFTPFYFDTEIEVAAKLLQDYIAPFAVDPSLYPLDRFTKVVSAAGDLLDYLASNVDWQAYDVIGFSVMMQQTVPSLALAKRIKAISPNSSIVFGGPNTSSPMGEEILRSFGGVVDYIAEGEVDGTITQLVRHIRTKGVGEKLPPGIWYRDDDGKVVSSGSPTPFHSLDSLPMPNFDPFFDQLSLFDVQHIAPFIPFETSRGCWWGAKHHCTFCGIGDDIMRFRSKSDERVLEEIRYLTSRHTLPDMFAVDSIINYRFYQTLLPALAADRERDESDIAFFFECKSNIRREHAVIFRKGGVREVQPGIESFSDHILELMDKGTTAARQLQCLKVLAEQHISVAWNIIYANPGETVEDYQEIMDAIPYMHHIPPLHAGGYIPMQVNRYAPYHERPESYGVTNITPRPYYKQLFPDPTVDLDKIAFYFDYELEGGWSEELLLAHRRLRDALDDWRSVFIPESLVQKRGPGFTVITDKRVLSLNCGMPDKVELLGIEHEVFAACDELTTVDELVSNLSPLFDDALIRITLSDLVAKRFIYRSKSGQLVNTPLRFEGDGSSMRTLQKKNRSVFAKTVMVEASV